MDNLLKYETQVQAFLQEGSSPGVLPFSNGVESESPEAELWSRVHLSYVISLKLGGRSRAIEQWADTRTRLLQEYAPSKTWLLSQAELKVLQQKLSLLMHTCQHGLDFQLSVEDKMVAHLTLFSHVLSCCACKDKELFDEQLLPTDITWPELVRKTYGPMWRAEIEFVCTKATNDKLLPMALHLMSGISVIHKHFAKLSTNQITSDNDCFAWLYELQQLETISSHCEDAILSYFDNSILQLGEDLNQLSSNKISSTTLQGVL